jgi:hypothetical protein
MPIVTASMHHAWDLTGIRSIGGFLDGQSIHIGSDPPTFATWKALDGAHQAMHPTQPSYYRNPMRFQETLNAMGCYLLLARQLRIAMHVMPQLRSDWQSKSNSLIECHL